MRSQGLDKQLRPILSCMRCLVPPAWLIWCMCDGCFHCITPACVYAHLHCTGLLDHGSACSTQELMKQGQAVCHGLLLTIITAVAGTVKLSALQTHCTTGESLTPSLQLQFTSRLPCAFEEEMRRRAPLPTRVDELCCARSLSQALSYQLMLQLGGQLACTRINTEAGWPDKSHNNPQKFSQQAWLLYSTFCFCIYLEPRSR
ncbi:hypothetical protein COO60DRAFT_1623827 [Scenedesmus sp. NREL 46B-D3]|nr:hypothetical protein COO60DRAFT_1623827 [Scenedesmus sp. NREL 46B-D3]